MHIAGGTVSLACSQFLVFFTWPISVIKLFALLLLSVT